MIIQNLIYLVFAALTLAASEPRKGFRFELVSSTGKDPFVVNLVRPSFSNLMGSPPEELMPSRKKQIDMSTFYVPKKSGSHTFINFGPHKRWFYLGAIVCDVDPEKSIRGGIVRKFIENTFERVTVDLVEGEAYPIRIVETRDFVKEAAQYSSAISETLVEGPGGFEHLEGNSYTAMNLKGEVKPSKSGGCAAPVLPHKGQLYYITGTNGFGRFAASDSDRSSEVHQAHETCTIDGHTFSWFEMSHYNLSVKGYFTPKKQGLHKLITLAYGCQLNAHFAYKYAHTNIDTPLGERLYLAQELTPGESYPIEVTVACDSSQSDFKLNVQEPDEEYIYDFSDYVVEEKP